jgi:hypothetical protein
MVYVQARKGVGVAKCSQCGQTGAVWQAYDAATFELIPEFILCSGCKPGAWTAPNRDHYFRPVAISYEDEVCQTCNGSGCGDCVNEDAGEDR